jgi:hypothetical protein
MNTDLQYEVRTARNELVGTYNTMAEAETAAASHPAASIRPVGSSAEGGEAISTAQEDTLPVTDEVVEMLLVQLIESFDDPDKATSDIVEEYGIDSWGTYQDAGIPTTDRGLVLRFRDGSEFQVDIVRNR